MMRILVTGGSGFIGSNLVRLLVGNGHEVMNVDKLTYAGHPRSLEDVERQGNYRFLRGDIGDSILMEHVLQEFRPRWVMNLAAESHVDRSIDGPAQFVQTNVVGTFSLLEAVRKYYSGLGEGEKHAFRFHHVSTDEVYGSLGETGLFSEESRYNPHSPYSASKASADHFVRAWHDTYGLPVIVTNSGNNYGPYQFPEKLIPLVLLKALRGEAIPVYGQGLQTRDWLYVEDHCEALFAAVSGGIPGRTYNIGGNNEMKNIDLVRLLCALLDDMAPTSLKTGSCESLINFVEDRPGHDFRYALDSSRIRMELGWKPKQDLVSGLKKTIRWYLDNEDWWKGILDGNYSLERLGRV